MKILLLEPFYEGSHAKWADGYQQFSRHEIRLLTLPGRHWKWRMYGAAVTLAEQFMAMNFEPDLILATDMLDLCTFQALTKKRTAKTPFAIYFHENQITYPWSPTDEDVQLKRNNQYGFVNYTSSLAADAVVFNSHFHQQSYLEGLVPFLNQFPDYKNIETIAKIRKKAAVLPLGMDLESLHVAVPSKPMEAVLLWNHRWEYDKNPADFFTALFQLQAENIPFKVIVLGKSYHKTPAIFAEAKEKLQNEMLHWGYAVSFEEYAALLQQADILPVTSRQDFFGGSVVEAIYCNCHPILPNRLAYPEHISEELRPNFFFEEKEGIYPKLKIAIETVDSIRERQNYKNFVAHYDWRKSVENYDLFFEKIK